MNIDIAKVIRDKNERLYRRLPGFAIKALARLICQDDINDVLARFGHLSGEDFVTAVLDDFGIERTVAGLDGPRQERPLHIRRQPSAGRARRFRAGRGRSGTHGRRKVGR